MDSESVSKLLIFIAFTVFRFRNIKLLIKKGICDEIDNLKSAKNKKQKTIYLCYVLHNISAFLLTNLIYIVTIFICLIKINDNITKLLFYTLMIASPITMFTRMLTINYLINNHKKLEDEEQTKFLRKGRIATSFSTIVLTIVINGLLLLHFPTYLNCIIIISSFLQGLLMITFFLSQLLRTTNINIEFSALLMISMYIFILIYGSFVFGSYSYVLQNNSHNIENQIFNLIKLGISNFFNYKESTNVVENIVYFIQYISGKIIEWMFLGCFSAIIIKRIVEKTD